MGLKQTRFDYGTHETGDSNFENDVYKCKKIHDNFIFSQDFTKEHLPERFQTENILELTKLLADMTVKINVNFTSIQRQKLIWKGASDIDKPYPFSSMAGKPNFTNGTGRIWDVFHRSKRMEFRRVTCPCPKCKEDPNPKRDVWIIKVFTATHVVFDTSEALTTKCILFYDSFSGKSSQKTIYGLKRRWSHFQGDLCILFCVTCDKEIKDLLKRKNARLKEIWQSLRQEYKGKMDENRLAIIVSHPHGLPKQISVGPWTRRVKSSLFSTEHLFTYSLSSCSGSSGAPVFILGSRFHFSAYCHCGSNKTENYSTCWLLA